MKKPQILALSFLLLLLICIITSMQAKAQETAVIITVSPDTYLVSTGNTVTYTAIASDASANSWDVTDSVNWSISSDAGGTWNNNTYTSAMPGFWTVTADNGAAVTGTASLEVTQGALAQFVFNPIESSQTAGNSFGVQVTALDSYGNIVTSYSGPAYLSDTSRSISPTITGDFVGGVWTGSVTVTDAGSDVITAEDINGLGNGSSGNFNVDSAGFDHFIFGVVGTQVSGEPFDITIKAKDAYRNTITNYTDTPFLTYSAGSVTPSSTIGGFSEGIWSGTVSVTVAGSSVSLGIDDGEGHTGTSNSFTVNHGVAKSVVVSPGSATITAGTSEIYSAVASDAFENSWDATDSVTWSISSDAGGSWNNNIYTSAAAGSWTVSATYASTVYNVGLMVSPAGFDHFIFGVVGTQVSGEPFDITIKAKDAYRNTITNYTDTPFLTYSAGSVTPSSTIGGFSEGIWSGTVSVTVAGSSVSLGIDDGEGHTGTSNSFTVNHGVAKSVVVSPGSATITAGTSEIYSAVASDAFENSWDATDSVTWSISSDAGGSWNNNIYTSAAAGSWTVSATYASTVYNVGLMVSPAGFDHFIFGVVGTQVSGEPFDITIKAKDAYRNTITNYTGTPFLTYSAGSVTPSSTIGGFSEGIWSGTVSVTVAGSSVSLGIDDGEGHTGTSNSFTVNHGVAKSVVVSPGSATITAGTSEIYSAVASDAFENSWDATDSVTWSISSDAGGSWNNNIYTSAIVGSWTVTADILGIHNTVSLVVNPGAATHLVVSSGVSQVAGIAFSETVTAKDANNNTATGYTGKIHFLTSDSGVGVSLPSDYTFLLDDLGTHTFINGIMLMTAGSQFIAATDTVTGSINGSQNGITVSVASGIHLLVSGFPSSTIAGVAYNVTVIAKDAYNNTVVDYSGTIEITSSDSKAILPSNAGLISGVGSFTVTLETVGSQSITATDIVTAFITGSENGITVDHAAVVANVVISSSAGSSVTAGLSKTFVALAFDMYDNSWDVTSSTSWSISSGAGGSWSNNIYSSAIAGSWTVTATYASMAYNVGLMVGPAGLDHFVFSIVGTQVSGVSFSITVTAKDAFENTAISYNGSPSLNCSAGSIDPGNMSAFVGGVGSTSVNVATESSSVTITVADEYHTGNSNSFKVTKAATSSPTPTATASPTPAPTPSHTPTSTPTPTPTPTPTFSTTPTPTATIAPAAISSVITVLVSVLPPFTFSDIILLLAFGSVILLITAELPYPHYGVIDLNINKKKLRNAISITGVLFLIIIAIKAIIILTI